MVRSRQAYRLPHCRNPQLGEPRKKQSGHHQANRRLSKRATFPGSHGSDFFSRRPRRCYRCPRPRSVAQEQRPSIEMVPMIKEQIARLQKPAAKPSSASAEGGPSASGAASASENGEGSSAVLERLEKLEHLVQEMNDRLKSMETRLPPPKP